MSDRRDPTRSLGLRRTGRGMVNRKVFELNRNLRRVLQEQDMAGLRARELPGSLVGFSETLANRLERAEMMVQNIVERALVSPPDWMRVLIERSVRKGVDQAGQELKVEVDVLDPSEVARFHSSSAAIEVQGISAETLRRVSRSVMRAIELGWTPDQLMREIRLSLEKITRQRLIMLSNMAVVRAVNGGKLFAYGENGVTKVGIEPEWIRHVHDRASLQDASRKRKVRERVKANKAKRRRKGLAEVGFELAGRLFGSRKVTTGLKVLREYAKSRQVHILTAGDDKVCQDCQDIAEDGPYDIVYARELIPAHINCRCAFVPYGDERFAEIEEENDD